MAVQSCIQTGGSGGGGEGKMPTPCVTNVEVGGLASGTDVSGWKCTEVLEAMVVKAFPPLISISLNPAAGVREKGNEVLSTIITFNGTQKTYELDKVVLYAGSTEIYSMQPYSGGSQTYTYTTAISTTTTLKAKVFDVAGKTAESSAIYTFVFPSFYGTASNLTQVLQTAKGSTRTYTFTNDKAVYKYPASFGNLTSIKDSNNIEYITTFDKTTEEYTNSYGVTETLNVYTQHSATTLDNFKFIFA